jgi:prophage regulatory protein
MSKIEINLDRPEPTDRILRLREVQQLVSVSRSTLWRWELQGQFPKRIRLSESNRNALTGWRLSNINAWMKSRTSRGFQIEANATPVQSDANGKSEKDFVELEEESKGKTKQRRSR